MSNEVRLFRKNQLGIGTWRIWYVVHEGHAILHYAHATVLNGAEVSHQDIVTRNQSGRSIVEQAELEMRSRISRQLDKGYKPTIDEAKSGVTNQLGLINPMLAHPIERVGPPKDLRNAYVQRKYDGHRSLITATDSDVIAYTRKGKLIDTIPHILNEIAGWIPDGVTLDGELYIHGLPLQTIGSIIKRKQADNVKLKFHWYDMHDRRAPGLTFHDRLDAMCNLIGTVPTNGTYEIVHTYPVSSLDEAYAYFRQFRAEKYEGAMLRLNNKPYQDSIRSSSLLKLKDWQDEEVTVLRCRPSKEGWAILEVQLDSGKIFETSAPGSIPEKTEVLENFEAKYKGRRLTIEYASLTNDGIPFHATALRWLDEL
jgi:DNA ligase-1